MEGEIFQLHSFPGLLTKAATNRMNGYTVDSEMMQFIADERSCVSHEVSSMIFVIAGR